MFKAILCSDSCAAGLPSEVPWLLATDSSGIIDLASELPEASRFGKHYEKPVPCILCILCIPCNWDRRSLASCECRRFGHLPSSVCNPTVWLLEEAIGRVHIDRSDLEETRGALRSSEL